MDEQRLASVCSCEQKRTTRLASHGSIILSPTNDLTPEEPEVVEVSTARMSPEAFTFKLLHEFPDHAEQVSTEILIGIAICPRGWPFLGGRDDI
jgi:hypothetical protein